MIAYELYTYIDDMHIVICETIYHNFEISLLIDYIKIIYYLLNLLLIKVNRIPICNYKKSTIFI